jgi:hypothetical protein
MKKHSAWVKNSHMALNKKNEVFAEVTPFYTIMKNDNSGIYAHSHNGENIMLLFTSFKKAEEFRNSINGIVGVQNQDGTKSENRVTPSNFHTFGFKSEAQLVYVMEIVYKNGGVARVDGVDGHYLKLMEIDTSATGN